MSRYILLVLAMCFIAKVGIAQTATENSLETVEQQLLRQVQQGEALYRDDVVRDALQRLYRVQPQHPQGLLAELRMAIRLEQLDTAQQKLDQLKASAPQSEAYADGLVLMRLTSAESKATLAQARLLAVAGRYDEARERYDDLLQGRYPSADIYQEYWQMRANQTGDYARAIKALETALLQFPRHPALLKTLINFYFSDNQPQSALHYLQQLADNESERQWAASREYDYLMSLTLSDYSQQAWSSFVHRYNDQPALHAKATTVLLEQQNVLNDPAWRAGQSGLSLLEAEKNPAQALRQLQQAVRAYPEDVELIGSLGLAYLRLGQRAEALRYFQRALKTERQDDRKSRWISLIHATQFWLLLNEAEAAANIEDWVKARQLYKQAFQKEPKDVFVLVGLGRTYLALGNAEMAWSYYKQAIAVQPLNESVQRGVLEYANSLPVSQGLVLLNQLPLAMQKQNLILQAKRDYELVLLKEQIEQAQRTEQWERAIELLSQAQALALNDPWQSYALATALRDQGRPEEALQAFERHRVLHHGEVNTQYVYALLLMSLDQEQGALRALEVIETEAWTAAMHELHQQIQESMSLAQAQQLYADGHQAQAMALLEENAQSTPSYLQLAEWFYEQGEYSKALASYQKVQESDVLPPYAYLGFARAWRATGGEAQHALDWYAHGLVSTSLLAPEAVQPQRDNVAFTRALRLEDEDDWLARGLRNEASALYQQQNPTLTVHNDHWWRSDGTPGLSELRANTSLLQIDYPIQRGVGFVRFDHVRMDAGTLEADTNGLYEGEFGTCSWGSTGGCTQGFKQKASGTSLAVGWEGDRLGLDLGTTPQGFAVTNWTGGLSYAGDWGPTGWRLTASRRPMSNSLLSFAGAKDLATGEKWGGVMATGGAVSLSWDQGEANGVWADLSHHQLKGRRVEDNQRTRMMGGYYRRLINTNNELLTVGVNAMHWRYQKDLGGYSFGQGGYYSPKQYSSLSLPIRYAKRTENWSFLIQGGVSVSRAKQHDGDTSRGLGYSLNGGIERRLSKHMVLGAGIDLQHSKDYAPSRGMLYLRYTFEPWQGSLPLGLKTLTPYADFK